MSITESALFETARINTIKDQLIKREETIAVAESVTSGLMQVALSTAPDAIQFFQGGITAYNLGQKYRHLFIEPIHAIACNCISQKIANDMAMNVCNLFHSDWGIGATGYATAVPVSNNQVFAFCAIAYKEQVKFAKKIEAEVKDPLQVQLNYVNEILKQFEALLK